MNQETSTLEVPPNTASSSGGNVGDLYVQACAHAIHYSRILAAMRIAAIAVTATAFIKMLSTEYLFESIVIFVAVCMIVWVLHYFENVYGDHWDIALKEGMEIEKTMAVFSSPKESQNSDKENILHGICNRLNDEVLVEKRRENRTKITVALLLTSFGGLILSLCKLS